MTTSDLYYDFGRRLELPATDWRAVPQSELNIGYVPVRYKLDILPTEETSFIESVHTLQVSRSGRTLKLVVSG